jgi:hypothetical protein
MDKQVKGRSREERDKARPGLRRVDSMDFLNQVEDEDEQEEGSGAASVGLKVPGGSNGHVGRAMRYVPTANRACDMAAEGPLEVGTLFATREGLCLAKMAKWQSIALHILTVQPLDNTAKQHQILSLPHASPLRLHGLRPRHSLLCLFCLLFACTRTPGKSRPCIDRQHRAHLDADTCVAPKSQACQGCAICRFEQCQQVNELGTAGQGPFYQEKQGGAPEFAPAGKELYGE